MAVKGNRPCPKPVKVCEFTNVVTGGTPSTRNNSYWASGDIPWLPSGVCQDCYVDSAPSFITKDGLENSAAKMMPPDTILIALTGATAGKVGHLTFPACANQSVTGILPSAKHHPRYLFHYLLNRRKKTLDDCYGGAQPHISQGYVKNIQVPLCELAEQRRIAAELDKICELKKNAETRLEKLDTLIKSRFVEMFGDIESGSQKFPVRYLEDVCLSMSAGKDVPKDSVKIKDDEHTVPIYSNGIEANGLYGYAREARITAPSITISGRGTIGFVCRREVPFVPIIRLVVATPDLNKVDLVYLESALRGRCAKNTGTTIPQLPVPVARRIPVMIPPIFLQREFAAFVDKVEKLKIVAKKSVEQLDTLYRAKLQEYFG